MLINNTKYIIKKVLKFILPYFLQTYIKKLLAIFDNYIVSIAYKKKFLSTLYYCLFNLQFYREHKAVLAGKNIYKKKLNKFGTNQYLLRRNIHRIEKGLIMKPRRNVFAESFIQETVDAFNKAIYLNMINIEEKNWAKEVLTKYFQVVGDTFEINIAKKDFDKNLKSNNQILKHIPYKFNQLLKSDIKYEDLKKLFIRRRAVRWYEDIEVKNDLIEKAIDIAALAPSACNRQPYTFYVSQTKEKSVEIAKCAGGTPGWAENIPCTIVIVGDLSAYSNEIDRHLIYIDSALAAMQLMLAFDTLGLSTCPINWPDNEFAEKKMDKILKLQPHQRPIMLLAVGYALPNGMIPFSQKKNSKELIKKV